MAWGVCDLQGLRFTAAPVVKVGDGGGAGKEQMHGGNSMASNII